MNGIIVASFIAVIGAWVVGYYRGEHVGYKRGRTDGDHLVAVERQQSQWRLCDRRYNRVHTRKGAQ